MLGAHSLDQLVFGASLGIWCALTSHFLVRDHLINHIQEAKKWHKAVAIKNSEPQYESHDVETGASMRVAPPEIDFEFDPVTPTCYWIIAYVIFQIVSIITYGIIDSKLPFESPEVQQWISNYEKNGKCGKFDIEMGLQKVSLNGNGLVTVFLFTYVFFLFRIYKGAGYAEGPLPMEFRSIKIAAVRCLTLGVCCAPFLVPFLLLGIK